jgi:hypothetical protein
MGFGGYRWRQPKTTVDYLRASGWQGDSSTGADCIGAGASL